MKNTLILAEKRFSDICGNLKYKITHKEYLIDDKQLYHFTQTFYNDEYKLMELRSKNGVLFCDYDLIWKVFRNEYNMSYSKTQAFITKEMLNLINNKSLTTVFNWWDKPSFKVIFKVDEKDVINIKKAEIFASSPLGRFPLPLPLPTPKDF